MSFWGKARFWFVLRWASGAQRKADQWQSDSKKMVGLLERRVKQLTVLQRKLNSINDTTIEDLEECKELMARHQGAVDALNAELEILKEVTVPGLTEAHQGLVDRIQAERADQKRRQIMAMPSEEGMR